MKRDPLTFLWDVKQASQAITTFTAGKSFEDYSTDLMLRSAVERQFEIIGEALNQLHKLSPETTEQIPNVRDIVDFRNLLIHGYASINHKIVWKAIHQSLPALDTAIDKISS